MIDLDTALQSPHHEAWGQPMFPEKIKSFEAAWIWIEEATETAKVFGLVMGKDMTDAAQNEDFVGDLRNAMKNSKGPGNFRNLFLYSPAGKKDGVQVIPVSEVAARDEFTHIKNVSRDDVLAAHRKTPISAFIPVTATLTQTRFRTVPFTDSAGHPRVGPLNGQGTAG